MPLESASDAFLTFNRYKKLKHNKANLYKESFRNVPYSPSLIASVLPIDSEPLVLKPLMYFNSSRKIQAGSIELRDIMEDEERSYFRIKRKLAESRISKFKIEITKILMGKGGIFEDFDVKETKETQNFLNQLCKEYAKGTIEKLRPSYEKDGFELIITPTNGGESIPFDGLSSGQKEIISTLFLIWKNTKDQPGIVLIDEPELHLNPEWQHKFIRTLEKLLPQNQYILATHSKEIFSSVEPEYRAMIRPDNFSLPGDDSVG